jgi:hypothetical protein
MKFLGNFFAMFFFVLLIVSFPLAVGSAVGWGIYALVGHGVLVPLGGVMAALASMVAGFYAIEQARK